MSTTDRSGAEKIRATIEGTRMQIGDTSCSVTISAGVSIFNSKIDEPVDLLFFAPIPSLFEKNIPRNIKYIPVDIFFVCLALEPKSYEINRLIDNISFKMLRNLFTWLMLYSAMQRSTEGTEFQLLESHLEHWNNSLIEKINVALERITKVWWRTPGSVGMFPVTGCNQIVNRGPTPIAPL